MGNTTSLVLGFPIRTSSDPRSVDSSPRHIAASHVLHRLPVPRHPPCALKHLQHKNQRSKIFEKIAHQQQTRRPAARCSQPLSTNQTPHPTTKMERQQEPPQRGPPPTGCGPVVSKPNSVSAISSINRSNIAVVHPNPTHYRCGPSIDRPGPD